MWHYPDGITGDSPVWNRHGIRILAGPSSLWLDADGARLPVPLFRGFDALGALQHITRRGDDHSWSVLDKTILGAELALSGSEQNPDLTGRDVRLLLQRALPGAVGPVEPFAAESPELLWFDTAGELAGRTNALKGSERIDGARLTRTIELRDAQVATGWATTSSSAPPTWPAATSSTGASASPRRTCCSTSATDLCSRSACRC